MAGRLVSAVLLAGLVLCSTATAAPPGAFELLEQVKRAYAELEAYSDLGELEITDRSGGREQTTLAFFEAALTPAGGLQWRIHGETEAGFEERVVWTEDDDAYLYSSLYRQYKPVPSAFAEISRAAGRGSYEALVVPLLLAGDVSAFEDLEGAMVDGTEPCGDTTCWIVSTSRMAGTIESELRIDQRTLLIREIRIRLDGDGGADRIIQVRHHPSQSEPSPFAPPEDSRRVADWQPPSDGDAPASKDPFSALAFEEEITVALLSVVARIVDSRGEPILDLEPDDLIVQVGQTETPVQSLEWTSSYQPPAEIPAIELAEARALARAGELAMDDPPATAPGKLMVFFVQVDFEPSRVTGHLKILPHVEHLLRSLHPDDRVAIVSFDSHLKLWQDFTRDRQASFEILKRAIRTGAPLARRSRGVSLVDHFDAREAADAATPEKALQLTAEALAELPGEKDLIYLGWGLGRFGAGGVKMTPDYEPAVRALDAAQATVFVLDVSQSDRHSLEVGLQNVAAHTGGTYARTFHFASQAVDRLARTITGYYRVTIDRTAQPDLKGRLRIRLRGQNGRVLFKPITLG